MKETISIVVPALNEEKNIKPALDTFCSIASRNFSDYEILVFDDGSTDNTGAVAETLSRNNPKIKVIHNQTTMGFGYNYKKGVELAKSDYIVMLPGDNEITPHSIENMFKLVGSADIIIPFTQNYRVRPMLRRIISCSFTKTMNLLFGLRLQYYNGPVIHKRDIIKKVPMATSGYAYQAEILVQLLKSGRTYREVGMDIEERQFGTSKALSLKNIFSVLSTVFRLIGQVYFKK